jgi:hypothetical protein
MAWSPSLPQRGCSTPREIAASGRVGATGWRALVFTVCGVLAWPAHAEAPAIPPHNRPDQPVPPPRPPANEVAGKIRAVFDAIVHDDPALAAQSFFPRDAFLLVKDIKDPGAYYDSLRRRFDSDIHALHASVPGIERAQYDRFELAQRGGYVPPHGEGNRLPYWASRHSVLYYRLDGQARHVEVRVLITWDDRWYVIHLNEFH